jgi:AraC-like DNA-binding protein
MGKLKAFIESSDGKTGWDFKAVCHQLNLGISTSYAGKLFMRSMGIGIREYAMKIRFAKAAERLQSTPQSIKEIAGDLGYHSPRDLARGFKKAFRMNPTDYRRIYHFALAVLAEEKEKAAPKSEGKKTRRCH